jgi:intermembrane space import and assembly protein 40
MHSSPQQVCLQEEEQRIQQQIDEALACPCVEDLRSGPCGKSFEAAFSCFLRHQAKHKVG